MTSLKMTLSMHSALASTPEPTYGDVEHLEQCPARVPSSPKGPCSDREDRVGAQQPAAGAQRHLLAVARPAAVAAELDPRRRRGRPRRAPRAPTRRSSSETSCSDDRPPARTATLTGSSPCSPCRPRRRWSPVGVEVGVEACRRRSSPSSPSWPSCRRPGSARARRRRRRASGRRWLCWSITKPAPDSAAIAAACVLAGHVGHGDLAGLLGHRERDGRARRRSWRRSWGSARARCPGPCRRTPCPCA